MFGGIIALAIHRSQTMGIMLHSVYRINLNEVISFSSEQSVAAAIHSDADPNPFKTSTTIQYTI